MLEKIINIKPDFQFKSKGIKNPYSDKFNELSALNRNSNYDSIEFSPAAVFLSKVNWKLKSKTKQTGEKLNLIFLIKDLEFSTVIDFTNFYKEPYQVYEVKKIYGLPEKSVNVKIVISIKKERLLEEENIHPVKINSLRKIFDRVISLGITGEIDKYESTVLNEFIFDPDEELLIELNFINNATFVLANKLAKTGFIKNFVFSNNSSDKIIIEKITAVDERVDHK